MIRLVALKILLLSVCCNCYAEITTISSLIPFAQTLDRADQNTLVIFDVDDVLITCKDPVLQKTNQPQLDRVCREYAQKMSLHDFNELYSIAMHSREVEVVDQKIYELIQQLHTKQVPTIALTHTRTGKFGQIEKVEDWRIQELSRLGFDFQKSSPFQFEKNILALSGGNEGTPNIKAGIIFTATIDKGTVLQEAISLLDSKPSKIIFIDDRMDNLESVSAFCEKHQILYDGFHYTVVESRPTKYVDENLIHIQLDTLVREGRWITSEEAAEIFAD